MYNKTLLIKLTEFEAPGPQVVLPYVYLIYQSILRMHFQLVASFYSINHGCPQRPTFLGFRTVTAPFPAFCDVTDQLLRAAAVTESCIPLSWSHNAILTKDSNPMCWKLECMYYVCYNLSITLRWSKISWA